MWCNEMTKKASFEILKLNDSKDLNLNFVNHCWVTDLQNLVVNFYLHSKLSGDDKFSWCMIQNQYDKKDELIYIYYCLQVLKFIKFNR